MDGASGLLAAARDAHARYAWAEARGLFEEAERDGALAPLDLTRLAECAWWTNDINGCIAVRERAFEGYSEAADDQQAAAVAVDLAKDYYVKGKSALGQGWLRRAERLLDGDESAAAAAKLERQRGMIAQDWEGDHETALVHARRAQELAEALGDADTHAIALHDEARALIRAGRRQEGLPLLDEATALAVSGDLHPLTTGIVYCNTISMCEGLADYGRAGQWTEAAERWCDRHARDSDFPGICRVHRAGLLRLRGSWDEAERQAVRAGRELERFNVVATAEAHYEVGELRRLRGDLQGAARAYEQAHALGREPLPGLALLRLEEGEVEGARGCLERALAEHALPATTGKLLLASVRVELAAGDVERAADAARRLSELAAEVGTLALAAAAAQAEGSVALARSDLAGAVAGLRRACRLWQELEAPYDQAVARSALAEAYRASGEEGDTVLELRLAQSTFRRLDAVPDAQRVERLLGEPPRREAPTLLFTDIVGSTALAEAVGDAAWSDLIAWHDRTLRGLFAEHGGREIDDAGDGFFVSFGSPADAVRCAIAIQRLLAAHRRDSGFAPQVRVGVHVTEAFRVGDGYKGRGVHEAARIAALAEGGEIVVSSIAAGALADVPVSEPRSVSVKGIRAPVEVVNVAWR
jgi:class 3 adenylate cyclase